MPFSFKRLEIPDVVLIEPKAFNDDRGYFMESYKRSDFEAFGIKYDFVQDNHSKSRKGTMRGLHYQMEPFAQGKLVRVVSGRIFDVAVDIREGSKDFGRWAGVELSAANKLMVFVPPGFAHGFLAMEDNTEVLYKATSEYSKEHEGGLRWNDPALGIKWPEEPTYVVKSDSEWPLLTRADNRMQKPFSPNKQKI